MKKKTSGHPTPKKLAGNSSNCLRYIRKTRRHSSRRNSSLDMWHRLRKQQAGEVRHRILKRGKSSKLSLQLGSQRPGTKSKRNSSNPNSWKLTQSLREPKVVVAECCIGYLTPT